MLSTFFYTGYFPFIPGTVGSLAGLVFYLLVKDSVILHLLSLAVLFLCGLLVIRKAEEMFGKKDARKIVIDEAVGMLVALFLVPQKPVLILFAFIAFRLTDIIKPFPAAEAERLKSPWGVMLDDIIAGVYANIATQVFFILAMNSGV